MDWRASRVAGLPRCTSVVQCSLGANIRLKFVCLVATPAWYGRLPKLFDVGSNSGLLKLLLPRTRFALTCCCSSLLSRAALGLRLAELLAVLQLLEHGVSLEWLLGLMPRCCGCCSLVVKACSPARFALLGVAVGCSSVTHGSAWFAVVPRRFGIPLDDSWLPWCGLRSQYSDGCCTGQCSSR